MSGSQSGIRFHRGIKKLQLDKTTIDDAIEFPENFEFQNRKEERRFFKHFVDDVTRFDEKVAESTEKIYSAATSEISKWILLKNPAENQKTLSVFSPDEQIENLRTALIQCNFTDISRLVTDLRHKIFENLDENQQVSDMVVTENDAIHTFIDRISSTKNELLVIMIRQFESLAPRFLDSLIALIYSNRTCRSAIPRLRLVVCVSTSPTFFTQTCSTSTLNLMKLKQFKFTKLHDVFSKIISTGVHSHFKPPRPKPKNIEEDDPSLLDSLDVAPALFSGEFLQYLENRFFACDYSVSALVRAVQFALLQKYLEDPLWKEETHDEELKRYDTVLNVFASEFFELEAHSEMEIHCAIQSNPDFWTETKEKAEFMERKQFLSQGNSKSELLNFCARVYDRMVTTDKGFCEKLKELMENLEEAEAESSSAPPQVETPSAKKKMSIMELQKQRKEAMQAKQQNPIRSVKSAIFAHVMTLFESTLKPYPSTWRNVIGKSPKEGGAVKTSLDSSDEHDIEHCLLGNPKNSSKPLSVAWRSLLCQKGFKTVPISDWAEEFYRNVNMDQQEAKGAFFAAVGQLEHIGLIRGSTDRKSTNVNVLYHPLSFIPDI